jgi:RNA polymerase sigma factor (sigma-70 family)
MARARIPPITLDLGWFHKYQRARSEPLRAKWRNRIMVSALPLVRWTVAKFPHAEDFDDLCQAGAIGLVRAIEKYDEKKGPWGPYAVRWIVHSIQEEIRRSRIVTLPRPARGPGRTSSVSVVSLSRPEGALGAVDTHDASLEVQAWETEATARAIIAGASDADALILEILASDHDLGDLFPADEVQGAILRARVRLGE